MSPFNISTNATNATNITDGDGPVGDGYDGDYYDYGWIMESYVPMLVYLPVAHLIGLCGLVGNVCVLIVMTHPSLSSVSYSVYLRFLAVSDTALLFARLFESTLFKLDEIDSVLPASDTVCRAHGFFDSSVSQLSPWLVVCLTVDRFIAVTFPLQRKRVCTKKNAFFTCLGFTAFLLVYNAVSVPAIIMSPNGFFCSLHEGFEWLDLFSFLIHSILPCILIFLLNMYILHKIRASSRQRRGLTGDKKEGGVVIEVVDTSSPAGQPPKAYPVDDPVHGRGTQGGGVVESLQSEPGSSASVDEGTRSSFLESVSEEGVDTKDVNLGLDPGNVNEGYPWQGVDRAHGNVWVTAASDEGGYRNQPGDSSVSAADPPQKTTTDADNKTSRHTTDKDRDKTSNTSRPGPQNTQGKPPKKSAQKATGRKAPNRVDRATISLTYVSLSAFLTLAPYALLRGLFMFFLEERDRQLQEDPGASVPANLVNINRCWDLLELIYLLNFGQNFYILLATNRQVVKAARKPSASAGGKNSRPKPTRTTTRQPTSTNTENYNKQLQLQLTS